MNDNELLAQVKNFMWLTTDAFDNQLQSLIRAALLDLNTSGVNGVDVDPSDPQILLAIATFCKINFGTPDESYDRLKASYNEMKAHLGMTTGYTEWTC